MSMEFQSYTRFIHESDEQKHRHFRRQFGVGKKYPHIKCMPMGKSDYLEDYSDDDFDSLPVIHEDMYEIAKKKVRQRKLKKLKKTLLAPRRVSAETKAKADAGDGTQLPKFAPIIDNKKYTEKWEAMDIMLDKLIKNSNSTVVDRSKNDEAVANAKQEGVKVRDFALKPATGASATTSQEQHVEVFPARQKMLEFYHMRYLVKSGNFNLSNFATAADDFDRLYYIGAIKPEYLDHSLLRALLAHGHHRRTLRYLGQPTSTGQILPPRSSWTVPANTVSPSKKSVEAYIKECEAERPSERRQAYQHRLAALKRSVLIKDYADNHAEQNGSYYLRGEENFGQKKRLTIKVDPTYIRPSAFLAKAPTSTSRPKEALLKNASPKDEYPKDETHKDASLKESSPIASQPAPPSTPKSAGSSASKPPSEKRGRKLESDVGRQKRARSSLNEDTSVSNRIRARISDDQPGPSTTIDKMDGDESKLEPPPPSEGRKRGFEWNEENPNERAFAKRLRILGGGASSVIFDDPSQPYTQSLPAPPSSPRRDARTRKSTRRTQIAVRSLLKGSRDDTFPASSASKGRVFGFGDGSFEPRLGPSCIEHWGGFSGIATVCL